MRPKQLAACLVTAAVTAGPLVATGADQPEHDMYRQHMQHEQGAMQHAPADTRLLVELPEQMRLHMLSNMRDHLLALSEIQDALAREQFEKAGEIAEHRLGMTSMKLHGAHEVGQYMPKEMAAIGTEMHRSASRFAVAASDAAVADDVKPALAALSDVTRQCVACHSGFRVQ